MISKKDLLAITGISYGQLYRWKRERLIPEEWFIKQSSYTGQETFFPREQILSRIQSIQDMKDKYSLEEMAKILSPEVKGVEISVEDLRELKELPHPTLLMFCGVLDKNTFTPLEIVLMILLVRLQEEKQIESKQLGELLLGIKNSIAKIKTGMRLGLLQVNDNYHLLIYPEQSTLLFDDSIELIWNAGIDDTLSTYKVQYKGLF